MQSKRSLRGAALDRSVSRLVGGLEFHAAIQSLNESEKPCATHLRKPRPQFVPSRRIDRADFWLAPRPSFLVLFLTVTTDSIRTNRFR